MNYEEDAIRKALDIIRADPYMGGAVSFLDGDPFAGLEEYEMHSSISKVDDVDELLLDLRNYAGTFMLRVDDSRYLFFVNTAHYGCFVIAYINGEARDFENLTISREYLNEIRRLIERMIRLAKESETVEEFTKRYLDI